MRRTALLLLVVLVAGTSTACGDDDAADAGSRVPDVGALASQLDGVADGCALEYEGLVDDQREVSICTLGDEIVELSVWTDADALDALIASAEDDGDPLVAGPNWSVGVADAGLAEQIATATGGTKHG